MDSKISINKIIAAIKATKGKRSGCQGLHSSLESDGYIMSICKWARVTSPNRIDALVAEVEKLRTEREQLAAENAVLAAENKKAVDAVTVFSNVTHDITEIICDELGHDRVAEIVAAYNDLGNMPATDRIVAGIKADSASPLVSALKVIANSEQHNGDTVVCDFDTLISVASGALRDYYAKQLREEAK